MLKSFVWELINLKIKFENVEVNDKKLAITPSKRIQRSDPQYWLEYWCSMKIRCKSKLSGTLG